MIGWFSQFASYAAHPAMLWGAVLIASPIIIHLLNRIRYRKVEFAAMEFLLESQKKNQSRILLEQLLLLLMRILIVLAIVALIAQLILNSSQASLFQGAQSHHVVLLDNSGSMKQKGGEEDLDAFDRSLKYIEKLISEGSKQPGSQKLSILLLSEPENRLVYMRDVDELLLRDFSTLKTSLRKQCYNQRLDLLDGLNAARTLLNEDDTIVKHLHVLSDYRGGDWTTQEEPASTIKQLEESKITVRLIRTVADPGGNIAITHLKTEKSTTTDIPILLTVTVKNFGEKDAVRVPLTLNLDGDKIPGAAVTIEKIAPGEEVTVYPEVEFDNAGFHRISVHIPDDSLLQDNDRFAAVEVTERDMLLFVDGSLNQSESRLAKMLLAPNDRIKASGFGSKTVSADDISQMQLDDYNLVYLFNIPSLSEQAQASLRSYVEAGGSLVWFLGNGVTPSYYNNLYKEGGEGLFPVPLSGTPKKLLRDSEAPADLAMLANKSYFKIFNNNNGEVKQGFHIFRTFIPDEKWVRDDATRNDRVKTIGVLRNGEPVIFEHALGAGKIFTCLTSFGPMGVQSSEEEDDTRWNDFVFGVNVNFYLAFVHDLAKEMMRDKKALDRKQSGDQIALEVDSARYSKEIEILTPKSRLITINASSEPVKKKSPPEAGNKGTEKTPTEKTPAEKTQDEEKAAPSDVLYANFLDTDVPGVYTARYKSEGETVKSILFAYNVPVSESDTNLIKDEELKEKFVSSENVSIQDATGSLSWLEGQQAGQNMMRYLLFLLFALLIIEQFMSYRLSFHTKRQEARV